jgi:hypothetical protein
MDTKHVAFLGFTNTKKVESGVLRSKKVNQE